MAESGDIYDQNRIDFLHRVQAVKSEIRTKFQNLRNTIDNHELRILEKVEEIQHEILENYERALTSLKEISQVRDQVLAGLKSNASNDFLKKNLEMYDREIEAVKKNSKIDSIFELVWSMEHLDLCDVCEVVSYSGNPNPETSLPMSRGHTHEELPAIPSPQMLPQPAFPDVTPDLFLPRPLPRQTLQPAFPSNKLVQPAFTKAPPNQFFSQSPLLTAPKDPPNQPFSQPSIYSHLKDPLYQPFSHLSMSAHPKYLLNKTFSQPSIYSYLKDPLNQPFSHPKDLLNQPFSQPSLFTHPKDPLNQPFSQPLLSAHPKDSLNQPFSQPSLFAHPKDPLNQPFSQPSLSAHPKDPFNQPFSQPSMFAHPKAPPNQTLD